MWVTGRETSGTTCLFAPHSGSFLFVLAFRLLAFFIELGIHHLDPFRKIREVASNLSKVGQGQPATTGLWVIYQVPLQEILEGSQLITGKNPSSCLNSIATSS